MAELSSLADAISKTLSPVQSQRNEAENFLNGKAASPGFSVALLQLIALESAPLHIRQATSVFMKNHIIKFYSHPTWEELPADDRNAVKASIVDILLISPVAVRRQLSEVLGVLAEQEYPQYWPALVPELATKLAAVLHPAANLQPGQQLVSAIDWTKLQGILETFFAVFERYPERTRSNELFTEINYSLSHTQEHVKVLFAIISKVIEDDIASKDPKHVILVFSNAHLLCKVFFCLCWQELPAYVEDNMNEYMNEMRKLLIFKNAAVDALSDDEPGSLDDMQATILSITDLFATKFDEEFRPFLQQFLSDAWNLLVHRSNAPKYDGVVTSGIKFLTTVSRSPDYMLFQDPSTLAEVCKSIVIPNLELREEDIELFEDNPVEYVRRDMEGSDTETRRRGAVELVKGLCSHYETAVTKLLSSYISEMLAPPADWKKQDTALYAMTAVGWKSGTKADGATETSSLIDVVDFFNNFVMPELSKASANPAQLETPIFVADLLKFVISFRNQIPKDGASKSILVCGKLLSAKEPVVKTYSSACIERLLTVKDKPLHANGNSSASEAKHMVPRMTKGDLESMLPSFLPAVVKVLKESTRPDEYMMRLVLRFCTVAQDAMTPYVETLVPVFVEIFVAVTANPANPLFNHYMFEAMAALIRFNATPSTVGLFESALLPPLCDVLIKDVQEFTPYVFQVLSQLMALHTDALPSTYRGLMPPILNPTMWDNRGFIPGMVLYIETYLGKAKDAVLSEQQLEQILGVFQKLLSSKATDHHGMHLLTTIFETFDIDSLSQSTHGIFSVLMLRLSKAKTEKFVSNLLCCLSTFVLRFGVQKLKAAFDSVQANVLEQLLRHVWLPEVVSIRNPKQRKLCAVALTDVGFGSELCIQRPYLDLWSTIVNTNVALTEGIVVDQDRVKSADDDEEIAAHLGIASESYATAYSQLRWGLQTGIAESPLVANKEPRTYLSTRVAEFVNHYSQFRPILQEKVDAQARQAIASYGAQKQ